VAPKALNKQRAGPQHCSKQNGLSTLHFDCVPLIRIASTKRLRFRLPSPSKELGFHRHGPFGPPTQRMPPRQRQSGSLRHSVGTISDGSATPTRSRLKVDAVRRLFGSGRGSGAVMRTPAGMFIVTMGIFEAQRCLWRFRSGWYRLLKKRDELEVRPLHGTISQGMLERKWGRIPSSIALRIAGPTAASTRSCVTDRSRSMGPLARQATWRIAKPPNPLPSNSRH